MNNRRQDCRRGRRSERAKHVLTDAAELAGLHRRGVVLVRAVTVPLEMPAEAFSVSPDARGLETHAKERASTCAQRTSRRVCA